MPLILAHHYTRRRTADPMHVFIWRATDGVIMATAVFTSPVNRFFGAGAVELARLVRLPELKEPLSMFVSACLRWLRRHTDLRYCLSYADTTVGHHGGIYQALSFIYVGKSKGNVQYKDGAGRIVSGRSFDQHAADNKAGWERINTGEKLLYVAPLRESRKSLLRRFGWSPLPYEKPGQA